MSESSWLTSIHGIEALLSRGIRGELLLERGHGRAKKLSSVARNTPVKTRLVSREQLRRETGNKRARIAALLPAESVDEYDLSGQHDGAPGRGATAVTIDLEDLCRSAPASDRVIVALDQVTDPHNVGAVLRSCGWFGVSALVHPVDRSAGMNETVMHVSSGAAARVPLCGVVNLSRSLRELASAGYWIYGMEASGERCDTAVINRPAVMVLGSEGRGLRPNVRSACDVLISVPGTGAIESLNVSVAAGIVLYEVFARRQP